MPRFYHQDDPDLSDLNTAKRANTRDYKKQYRAQDGLHDNLGQLAEKDAIFNTLSTRLTGLYNALTELSQHLNTPLAVSTAPLSTFSSTTIASLQQIASKVLSEIRAIQTIMGRIKNFNVFTPPEAQQLQQLVEEINDANGTIIGASQLLGNSDKAQRIDSVIETYAQEFQYLMQFLNGASKNYKALEGVAMTGGAMVPAFNGEGVFGSDGYSIGDFFSYSSPRRFY